MEPLSGLTPNGFAERREADTEAALRELLTLTQEIVINPRSAEHTGTITYDDGLEGVHITLGKDRRIIYIPPQPNKEGPDDVQGDLWLVADHVIEAQDELEQWTAIDAANFMMHDGLGGYTNGDDLNDLASVSVMARADPEGMLPIARTTGNFVSYLGQGIDVSSEQAASVTYTPCGDTVEEMTAIVAVVNDAVDMRLSEIQIEEWRTHLEVFRDSLLEQ